MTAEERDERVAVHEAGHAVAAWFCTAIAAVDRVTIDPAPAAALGLGTNDITGGHVAHRMARLDNWRWCAAVVDLAGFAAEAMVFDSVQTLPSARDLTDARDNVRACGGLSYPWPTPDVSGPEFASYFVEPPSTAEVAGLAKAYYTARHVVLATHGSDLRRLANALRRRRYITEPGLVGLLGSRKMLHTIGLLSGRGGFVRGGDWRVRAEPRRIAGRVADWIRARLGV